MGRYIEIQQDAIRRYRIDLCDGTRCRDGDWSRMHAHPKQRRVCKWHPKNSVQATFDLLHEIGHIETTKAGMRRAESEYHATAWAIDRCAEYGIEVPEVTIRLYQEYIDMTEDRGRRRGGTDYGDLTLRNRR